MMLKSTLGATSRDLETFYDTISFPKHLRNLLVVEGVIEISDLKYIDVERVNLIEEGIRDGTFAEGIADFESKQDQMKYLGIYSSTPAKRQREPKVKILSVVTFPNALDDNAMTGEQVSKHPLADSGGIEGTQNETHQQTQALSSCDSSSPEEPSKKKRRSRKKNQSEAEEQVLVESQLIKSANKIWSCTNFKGRVNKDHVKLVAEDSGPCEQIQGKSAMLKCLLCERWIVCHRPGYSYQVQNYRRHITTAHKPKDSVQSMSLSKPTSLLNVTSGVKPKLTIAQMFNAMFNGKIKIKRIQAFKGNNKTSKKKRLCIEADHMRLVSILL